MISTLLYFVYGYYVDAQKVSGLHKKIKRVVKSFKEPEMDFDPLSLYTPSASTAIEHIIHDITSFKGQQLTPSHCRTSCEEMTLEYNEENEDDLIPLHILDLPMLRLQPPYPVFVAILKLMAPDEVLNFQQNRNEHDVKPDEETIFSEKLVSPVQLENAVSWLVQNCPRLSTLKKLSLVPALSLGLRANSANDYNAYITRIVSNELSWMTDAERDEIHSLASLRISENCGRMAQPQLKRKIYLSNLEQYDRQYIYLNEPSMTNDNLGLKTWGSSLILGSRLLRAGKVSSNLGEPVLELGSGTGLVGICCCLMGMETTLTDLPQIVPNLRKNIELNKLEDKTTCVELDWSAPERSPVYEKTFATVVVSDPVYSSQHPYWVVNMIEMFLSHSINDDTTPNALIEVPLRPKFENERQLLWDLMLEKFVEVESDIEDGCDDFGDMKFCYKRYIRK